MLKLLVILNAIISIGLIPMVSASLSDDIGVQLSKTCRAVPDCPTYEEILLLFPDTSDQRISGQFVFEDGYLQRGPPAVKNEFRFYESDSAFRVFIDPAPDIANRVKMIVIESQLDEYPIKDQVITNSSVDVGTIRYVNEGCYRATLSAENWQFTLGDTMMYMKYDCKPEFTNIDSIKKKTWERTIHDITTSYKYQLEQWFKVAINKCGQRVCFYE